MIQVTLLKLRILVLSRALKLGNGALLFSRKLSTSIWLFFGVTFGIASVISFASLNAVRSDEVCLRRKGTENYGRSASLNANEITALKLQNNTPVTGYAHIGAVSEIKPVVKTEIVTETVMVEQEAKSTAFAPAKNSIHANDVAAQHIELQRALEEESQALQITEQALSAMRAGRGVRPQDAVGSNPAAAALSKEVAGFLSSELERPASFGFLRANKDSDYLWKDAGANVAQYFSKEDMSSSLAELSDSQAQVKDAAVKIVLLSGLSTYNSAPVEFSLPESDTGTSDISAANEATAKTSNDKTNVKSSRKIYRKRQTMKSVVVKKSQDSFAVGDIAASVDKSAPVFEKITLAEKAEINDVSTGETYTGLTSSEPKSGNNPFAESGNRLSLYPFGKALTTFNLNQAGLSRSSNGEISGQANSYIVPAGKFNGMISNALAKPQGEELGNKSIRRDWRFIVSVLSLVATVFFGTISGITAIIATILGLINHKRADFKAHLENLEYRLKEDQAKRDRLEHELRVQFMQLQILKLKQESGSAQA